MAFQPHKIKSIRALHDHIIVDQMDFNGRQLSSGIVLLNDNGTTAGIRPRWAHVFAIGDKQTVVRVGQWVMIAHGRWTRGLDIEDPDGVVHTIRRIDPKDILLISDTEPGGDDTLSDAIQASLKDRY